MHATDIYLETGRRRVFAVAVDWPGWARSARTADAALEALAEYLPRYAPVAARAGHPLPPGTGDRFDVVETTAGGSTTDFGAPGAVPDVHRRSPTGPQAGRLGDLVAASRSALDDIAATAPPTLRKGPRGGGRDRDDIVRHVLSAEHAYARKIGVRLPEPDPDDRTAVDAFRAAVDAALRAGDPEPPHRWPVAYAAQRIAWHALDHAWEIEDRSVP